MTADLIAAHARHLKSAGRAERTILDRVKLLRRLESELPMGLDEASVEELENFLATPGFTVKTQETYYAHIAGYFRWACDPARPRLDYNPAAGLIRPKSPKGVPHPVTDEELRHALAGLDEPYLTYVKIAAYASARAGEIATLTKEDITEQLMWITGKGGKTRCVGTHPEIWRAVRHFPAGRIARKVNTDEPRSAKSVSDLTSKKLKKIGLPKRVTLHSFRHWFGTTALRPKEFGGAGASMRAVQEMMGHESPATTAIYTLVSSEERAAAIRALPSFVPAAS